MGISIIATGINRITTSFGRVIAGNTGVSAMIERVMDGFSRITAWISRTAGISKIICVKVRLYSHLSFSDMYQEVH